MATWTDGPEYAPTHRPDVFVEPDVAGLPSLDPAPDAPALTATPAPVGPAGGPGFAAPTAPALDALVPAQAPQRDPHEAFDVAATPMTAWSPTPLPPPTGDPVPLAPPAGAEPAVVPTASAWGHAHAAQATWRPPETAPVWAPTQPIPAPTPPAVESFPPPRASRPLAQVNPGGFPSAEPPPWQQPTPSPGLRPVSLGAIARATTPGVLICLGIAVLVVPLSFALLLVGSVLAARVRHRRRIVGRMFTGGILGSLALGWLGSLGYGRSLNLTSWYEGAQTWAHVAAILLLVAVPLVVGDALRRGEAPEDLP